MIPYFDDLPDGYVMYVDNIMPMQRLTYTVQYIGADVYNITPEYLNCDAYPDIKVAGRNGCNKKFNYYLNHGQSWNTKQFDLAQWLIQIQQ